MPILKRIGETMVKKNAAQAMESELAKAPGFDWSRDWKWLLVLGAVSYLVCFGVRLLEVPIWDHPGLRVNGDPIMATHDSYYWLAAAKGVRIAYNSFLDDATRWLAAATGMSLAQVAFWFPPIIGSLVAPLTFLWGRFLGGPWAGLLAGIIGGLAPGFFSRTRLGYYDSDMMTLFSPMLVALLLAWLLVPLVRRRWFGSKDEPAEERNWLKAILTAAVFGLVTRLAGLWHADLVFMHVVLWYAAVLMVLVFGRPGLRGRGVLLLTVMAMTAFPNSGEFFLRTVPGWDVVLGWLPLAGWLYILILAAIPGGVLLLADKYWKEDKAVYALVAALAVLAVLVLHTDLLAPFYGVVSKLWLYVSPSEPAGAGQAAAQAAGPVYPSIIQSIIEAKQVGWGKVLMRIGPLSWISLLGVIGYFWVCWRRPMAVFLLPLLVLALAGYWMGIRFTMFGGPMVALGLAVPLVWLTRMVPDKWAWSSSRSRMEAGALTVAAVLLLIPLVVRYAGLSPTPVVDKPHAEALIELGDVAPEGAMVWTWWDWGYATQFYAGRMTVVDGGLHAGRDIYPVALALSTDSLAQANRIIRYSAAHGYCPADVWDTMSGRDAADEIDWMRMRDVDTPGIAPQYLVVGWHDFNILEWISTFGNWNLADGKRVVGTADRIRNFRFDPSHAAVVFENGKAVPISSVDSLEPDHVNHKDYWGNAGPHLLFNKHRGDAYIMDDTAYNSVQVQLMLKDPSRSVPVLRAGLRGVAPRAGVQSGRVREVVRPAGRNP